MKREIAFFCLLLLAGSVFAQDVNSKQPIFKVSSFSGSLGFAGAITSNTDADYYGLQKAVENPNLFVDVTDFDNTKSYYYGGIGMYGGYYEGYNNGSGNGSFVFNLGLTPYSKKLGKYRTNRELRISVGTNIGNRNTFNYYDNNTFTIDTLKSINGNGVVYADSVINTYYYYSLEFTDISFGLSYIFKTNMERRVHFYAGLGVNYAIALKSVVNVTKDVYKSVNYYNQNQSPSTDDPYWYGSDNKGSFTYSYSSTNLTNPMQFVRFYIPVGLSLLLSKKETSFFNHVDLYTELNPGVELQIIGQDKTYANPYMGVAFIGINYHW